MYLETKEVTDKSPEALLLSHKQWNRLCDVLTAKERRAAELQARIAEKEAVRDASKHMTKDWTNTISGLRKERLEARKTRAHREEEQRLHLDMQETRYQERRRKQVLDQCKKKLYFETDRVKNFHSALALTDAIIERDKQLEFNKKKGPAHEAVDAEYEKAVMRDIELFNDAMRKEKEKKHLKNLKFAENVKLQMKENSKIRNALREEEFREGRVIMEEDQHHKEEEMAKREAEKLKRKGIKKELDLGLHNKKLVYKAQEKMEEEDQKRADTFVEAKREMAKLKKERQAAVEKAKNELKDKMIKHINQSVGVQRLKEEQMYQKAVQEKVAQDIEKMRADEDKQKQIIKEINASHKKQLEEKEENRIDDKRAELVEWRKIKDEAEEHEARELDKLKKAKQKSKETQVFQVIQKVDRRNRQAKQLQELLEERLKHYQTLEVEEEEFDDYARKIIRDRRGHNVYPLKKASQAGVEAGRGPVFHESSGIRPKYLSTDEETADLTYVPPQKPPIKSLVNNRRRLGFVC